MFIIEKAYREESLFVNRHNLTGWSFQYDAHLPNNLAMRGFPANSSLPKVKGYRFEKYSRMIWDLIRDYVQAHVEHAYQSPNEEVRK